MVEPRADGVPVVTGTRLLQRLHDPVDPSRFLGWLLAEEGLLFAGSAGIKPANLSPPVRAAVRWIAHTHGFLVPTE